MTVRVLLVDDHALLRAGMRVLFATSKDIEVVAEAASGRDVPALVAEHRPDVVLMDVAMPGLGGLEATARVLAAHPGAKVLILSMHGGEEYVLQALRAGAAGYVLKTSDPGEVERAVLAVARGDAYFSPTISRQVLDDYLRRVGGGAPLEPLTSRQREILQLIAEGHSTRGIAELLDLSVKTVEAHRAQIMQRLDVHDVAGLVRYAIRVGLVTAEK